MSSEISCKNLHDDFCFVCGHYIYLGKKKSDQKKKRYMDAPKFVEEFKKRFKRDPLKSVKEWSPRLVCSKCYHEVTEPDRTKSIVSPMEWFAPKNHPEDCYFCKTTSESGKRSFEYADVASVKRPKLVSDKQAAAAVADPGAAAIDEPG